MGEMPSRPRVSLRGMQSCIFGESVCAGETEREKNITVKNDSLDHVHTNADIFENTSFSPF